MYNSNIYKLYDKIMCIILMNIVFYLFHKRNIM
jgi:hypothetical protein